ncbi:MAG: hypothetical protein ABUL55_01975 [Pseudomonadota bacterium]
MANQRWKVANEIEGAVESWLETVAQAEDARKNHTLGELLKRTVQLQPWKGGNNLILREGHACLKSAACLLVEHQKLQRKISEEKAVREVISLFQEALEEAKTTGVFQTEDVVAKAEKAIREMKTDDGLYVMPVEFAPKAKNTDFRIGSARLVAKDLFEVEHAASLRDRAVSDRGSMASVLYKDWVEYVGRYDHVITVELTGFHKGLAWATGREVAEFVLNLIRLVFGYSATKDIRLAGGYAREHRSANMRVSSSGEILFSASRGWPGANFDDEWAHHFDDRLAPFQPLCASFASWLASGRDPTDAVLERLRYANQLIAEAYSEPHDHMRVVRLIAALEGLALVAGKDKADTLAYRSACVGGYGGDPGYALEIYEAVREAYAVRSEIVHGDGPNPKRVATAFRRLERHAAGIVFGFLDLFAKVRARQHIQSVASLRHAVTRAVDRYYWGLRWP